MLITLFALLACPSADAADVALTHQARLLDGSGQPLNGVQNFTVQLYDGAGDSANTLGPAQNFMNVPVSNGYVSLELTVDADDLTAQEVWIGYAAGGATLDPRQRLTHVPFAARATVAERIPVGAPGTCTDDGAITFDPNTNTLSVCSDGAWQGVSGSQSVAQVGSAYRFDNGNTADSCLEYLTDAGPGLPSGYYTLSPGGPEFDAYCDMTTDGGGWTLCFAYDNAVYDIGNWPSIPASRNKALAQTWGHTDLFGPGSRQGNFCNLIPVSANTTELAAEAREVSSGRTLDRATFTLRQSDFFTQIHNAGSSQYSCLTSTDGTARFMYGNYTSPSAAWNGGALQACSGAADTSQIRTAVDLGAFGTDGLVVMSFANAGEAPSQTLSLNVNWYQSRSNQTLFANTSGNGEVTKFGINARWTNDSLGRSSASPGPYMCSNSCGYTDQVQDVFGQRLWVR